MTDRQPETWPWRIGALPGDRIPYGAPCPLCGKLVWCGITAAEFSIRAPMGPVVTRAQVAAGNKHLAEKHPLPPPEPEGWWPCTE